MARKYTREFKLSAVKLVKEQGYSVVDAAKCLGVDDANVRGWIQTLGAQVKEGPASQASLRQEIAQLRKDNARLLQEREILKKAAAFFAKEQM